MEPASDHEGVFHGVLEGELTFKQSMWLVPVFLALHNAEEALTMPRWVIQNLPLIRKSFPVIAQIRFSQAQLSVSLVIATILPLLITIICAGGRPKSMRLFFLFLLQMVVAINVFVPHLLASAWLHLYNPGLVTAVFLNLPYSFYLFRKARREHYLGGSAIARIFLLALIVYLPAVWTIHFVGEWIAAFL